MIDFFGALGIVLAMKAHLIALLIALAAPAPVLAQEPAPEEDGFDLMEEGAKLLLRGLMAEMEPAFNEMGNALQEVEPRIKELLSLIDDMRYYDAPYMTPNGDIVIPRRKTAPAPPEAGPKGEIDL